MAALAHAVAVTCDRGARYEWGAICICGWRSRRYVAERAAQLMADDHRENS